MEQSAKTRLMWGRTGDGYVLRVDGRGTLRESPTLREVGASCLDDDSDTRLTVDLSGCDYLDSTFLGCLVALHKHGSRQGRDRFVIAAPSERRRALLSATALDRYFCQRDVAPEALERPLALCPDQLDARSLGLHVLECHRELAKLEGPGYVEFARLSDRLAQELDGGTDSGP